MKNSPALLQGALQTNFNEKYRTNTRQVIVFGLCSNVTVWLTSKTIRSTELLKHYSRSMENVIEDGRPGTGESSKVFRESSWLTQTQISTNLCLA